MAFCNKFAPYFSFNYWLEHNENKVIGLFNYFEIMRQIKHNHDISFTGHEILSFVRCRAFGYHHSMDNYRRHQQTNLNFMDMDVQVSNEIFKNPLQKKYVPFTV